MMNKKVDPDRAHAMCCVLDGRDKRLLQWITDSQISALIADQMGFKALYVTGYGTVASTLGIPDAGIATYRDMIERIAQMVKLTRTPIIADADTGYGGLLNVRHTVRGYEDAGVSAIQLEDQEFPKKCGHTPYRRVIPLEDMVAKVRVAVDSRTDPNFLVIARTDARTGLGFEEAVRRGAAYAEAGADLVHHPLAARGVHVGDDDPGALLGEGLGDALTKAGTGAGDDGSLVG